MLKITRDQHSGECTKLDPSWENAYTTAQFPVLSDTTLTVLCRPGTVNLGTSNVTCVGGTTYKVEGGSRAPDCHRIGKFGILKQHLLIS